MRWSAWSLAYPIKTIRAFLLSRWLRGGRGAASAPTRGPRTAAGMRGGPPRTDGRPRRFGSIDAGDRTSGALRHRCRGDADFNRAKTRHRPGPGVDRITGFV